MTSNPHPNPLTFSQPKPIQVQRLDLASLIIDVATVYTHQFEAANVDVEMDVPHNLWVELDPLLMREAFRKLIDNAIEAMPSGGQLTITSLVGRRGLEIEFADSGRGVSDELKERLFEPFATTKHDHAGLGLSLVRDIVTSHDGTVTVDDCPEGGAAFTLSIPLQAAKRQAA